MDFAAELQRAETVAAARAGQRKRRSKWQASKATRFCVPLSRHLDGDAAPLPFAFTVPSDYERTRKFPAWSFFSTGLKLRPRIHDEFRCEVQRAAERAVTSGGRGQAGAASSQRLSKDNRLRENGMSSMCWLSCRSTINIDENRSAT